MVTAFAGDDGAVQRVLTVRVEPRYTEHGREFVHVHGTESSIDADLVLLAIGFDGPPPMPLLDELQVTRDTRRNIAVDDDFATQVGGVFAAGDAVRGASLIVWAIADGRVAARSCDRYLMGSSRL
ncbi:MAG: FAD-dependent oxidoreductase [Candidatus Dormibacteraeota bacterium]|nr:FAD-dependent oxidoreductase [Candidatus Dormibacteraeota bacterium]